MSLSHFTFNGISSGRFGLLVSNVSVFGAPARVVEKVQIPYRNGDLLIDSGAYNNYIVAYEVSIIQNTAENLRAIANWLLNTNGYCELTDDYNPEEFRMASYYNQLDYTMTMLNRYGSATISFDCKPQRYLTSGQTPITYNTTYNVLENPTYMPARPLIRINGNGGCSVAGTSITVTNNANSYIYIDCEKMQCYRGTTNKGNNVTMADFPVLPAGDCVINAGTTTSIVITPRWWKL